MSRHRRTRREPPLRRTVMLAALLGCAGVVAAVFGLDKGAGASITRTRRAFRSGESTSRTIKARSSGPESPPSHTSRLLSSRRPKAETGRTRALPPTGEKPGPPASWSVPIISSRSADLRSIKRGTSSPRLRASRTRCPPRSISRSRAIAALCPTRKTCNAMSCSGSRPSREGREAAHPLHHLRVLRSAPRRRELPQCDLDPRRARRAAAADRVGVLAVRRACSDSRDRHARRSRCVSRRPRSADSPVRMVIHGGDRLTLCAQPSSARRASATSAVTKVSAVPRSTTPSRLASQSMVVSPFFLPIRKASPL